LAHPLALQKYEQIGICIANKHWDLFSGENWEIPTGLIFCCFNQLVVQSEWIGTFKVRKSNSLSSFSYVNGIYNGYFGVYPTSCCLHLASGQSVEESQYQAWRAASSDFSTYWCIFVTGRMDH